MVEDRCVVAGFIGRLVGAPGVNPRDAAVTCPVLVAAWLTAPTGSGSVRASTWFE